MRNKRKITILIVGGILFFFLVYFFLFVGKSFIHPQNEANSINSEVVFEQPKLKVFGQTRYLNEFPDTVKIHYPYLLVIAPEEYKRVTTVYDLEQRKEIGVFKEILLDYWQGAILYNKGEKTFYNQTSLGAKCDLGLIKSKYEILCTVPKNTDPLDNKLVSFNFQTGKEDTLSSQQNLITAFYFINNTLYVGEQNILTKKAYLKVGDTITKVPSQVDIIYPLQDKMYFATFKSSALNKPAEYYKIDDSNRIVTELAKREEIKFY